MVSCPVGPGGRGKEIEGENRKAWFIHGKGRGAELCEDEFLLGICHVAESTQRRCRVLGGVQAEVD